MKTISISTFAVLIAASTFSCGKKKSDGSSSTTNVVTQSETASSLADEATDSIADGGSTGSASSFVAPIEPATDITLTKTCEVNADGQAVIAVSVSGEVTREKSITRRIGTIAFSSKSVVSGSQTQTWTKADGGQALTCNAGNNVRIGWATDANVAGLKLDIAVDRKRTVTLSKTIAAISQESEIVYEVKGSRKVEFVSSSSSSTEITIARKVSIQDLKRSLTGKNFDGETVSGSVSVSTDASAPLEVTVVRNKADSKLDWKTKTIASGTIVATSADGSKVDATFEDVVYSKSATNVCIPESGKISGKMYATDGTTVDHTYEITYADGSATKTVDDVEDPTFLPSQTCDLANE